MTALRLIQRMKRDSMHTGRRPSGLCGAALLMAARLHEFNRSVSDIIKIVKVHESTLRKRLLEFGETPSSSLSLDEFMTVDLEEEQDPPSFKAARKKDHNDRLQKIMDGEEVNQNLTALQLEIEKELREISNRKRSSCFKASKMASEADCEARELNEFMQESTIYAIEECVESMVEGKDEKDESDKKGIPPSFSSLGLGDAGTCAAETIASVQTDGELVTDDLDDDELDQYIMSDREAKFKDTLWMKINEEYLQAQKEKEEKLAKEREEGKPEKKRKKYSTKKAKNVPAAKTAGEAIEKMLQEKKMSTKINYEVLKSLTLPTPEKDSEETIFSRIRIGTEKPAAEERKAGTSGGAASKTKTKKTDKAETEEVNALRKIADEGDADEFADDAEPEKTEMSLTQLLNQHRNDVDEGEEFYGDEYEDEEY
ncbi:UNVERIFIED_CONTAM: hypothetical protein PYX00_007058 [Menopon gallinae]|uniref:Transcription factor IIIB 90 kDa subunit n=1 Tax=Menopon gallinae TaxID=328185 RepID=A0AAW2HHJ3_9NEOP